MNARVLAPNRHIRAAPPARLNSWIAAATCQGRISLATGQQQCHCSCSFPSTTYCIATNDTNSSTKRIKDRTYPRTPVSLVQPGQQRRQRSVTAAAVGQTSSESEDQHQPIHTTWTSPDGAVFQVLEMRSHCQQCSSGTDSYPGSSTKPVHPPVVLVHGLFRAAWYWQDSLMPALAAAGFDSYAISLRGQGSSQLYSPAADSGQESEQGGSSSSSRRPFAHGVPLAVNIADIAAFISSRGFKIPPVLIGHSLGGMFVQEYLLQLLWQQQTAAARSSSSTAQTRRSSSNSVELPHLCQPVPAVSGAVLLASACAGTVMSFDRFLADVGLLEFLYQMYIVFSCAHLNNLQTARYCWWQDCMDEQEAARHLKAIRASSTVLPYVTKEVGAWRPAPPEPSDLQQLPPVLALGGAADRIIRPFQVAATADYWGADVVLMEGVTHDVLLGPQAPAVSQQLLAWLQEVPLAGVRPAKDNVSSSSNSSAIAGGSPMSTAPSGGEQLTVQSFASYQKQQL